MHCSNDSQSLDSYQLTVRQTGDPLTTADHHCSASIGVILFVNHQASQTDLIKWVDAAMYQAKDEGRTAARLYAPNAPVALVNTT